MRDTKPKLSFSEIPLQPSPPLYSDVYDKPFSDQDQGFHDRRHESKLQDLAFAGPDTDLKRFESGQRPYSKTFDVESPAVDKQLYKDEAEFQHPNEAYEKTFPKPEFGSPLLHSNGQQLLDQPLSTYGYLPSLEQHEQMIQLFPLHFHYGTKPNEFLLSQISQLASNYPSQMGVPLASPAHVAPDVAGHHINSSLVAPVPVSEFLMYSMMQPDLSAMHGMISGQEVFSGNVPSKGSVVVPDRASCPQPASVPISVPVSTTPNSRKRPRSETGLDLELSLLAAANQISASSLEDIAEKVKLLDSGDPVILNDLICATLSSLKQGKSDKHHQALALSWIQKSCEASGAAVVPRNRFYARYVQMCACHNINPLCSGLFFRLIRLLFPSMKTRRLGLRGRSKYHFCGVKLLGELSVPGSPVSTYSSVGVDSPQSLNCNTNPREDSPMVNRMLQTPVSLTQVTDRFQVNDLAFLSHIHVMVEHSIGQETMSRPLNLPSMGSYLPKDFEIDNDLADTLHSLYKIYCTTLFELVRYLQVDRLFGALSPSPALLATPIFKILVDPNILEWVYTCDTAMYGAMLKMLARLHLLNVPAEIMTPLEELTALFMEKLSVCLNSKYPKAFVEMKLKLARRFVQLLKRLLQCIKTGSRLTTILADVQEKDAMIGDWNRIDFLGVLLSMITCADVNLDALLELLVDKVPQLLEDSTCTLATCSKFVIDIPAMFPKVSPWLFSLLLSNLLTTCLREMSSQGAKSFDSWWNLRCWVDEYILWSFELGGFFREEYHRWSYSASSKDMNLELLLMHDISANTDAHSNSFVDLLDDLSGDKDWF